MERQIRKTLATLLVVAMAALAVIVTVSFASPRATGPTATQATGVVQVANAGTTNPIGVSGNTLLTCPRTGCTYSTCHGANGQPPPTR